MSNQPIFKLIEQIEGDLWLADDLTRIPPKRVIVNIKENTIAKGGCGERVA